MNVLVPSSEHIFSTRPRTKKPYDWTIDKLMELIKLYKETEILWNPEHPNYKNREMACDAWEALSDKLGVNICEVRRKAGNLATQFHREYRKEMYMTSCGDHYSSPWFPYQHLMFLKKRRARRLQSKEAQGTSKDGSKKYLKNAKRQQSSTSNLTGPLTAEDLNILAEPAEEESGFEIQECTEPEDKRVKVEAMEYFMDFPSGSSSSMRGDSRLSNDSFDSKPILANTSQNLDDDDDVVFESQTVVSSPIKPKTCSNRPGPKSKVVPTLAQIRERSDLFGEYVAAKLRSLKTDSARNRVECLIANILYEASRGTFDDAQSTTDLTNILQAYLNSTKDLQTPTDGSFSDSADVKPAASINLL